MRGPRKPNTGERHCAAACSHAWISGGVYKNGSVRPGDDRRRPFKYQVNPMPSGKIAGMTDAIILDLSGGKAAEAGHFSRMGR